MDTTHEAVGGSETRKARLLDAPQLRFDLAGRSSGCATSPATPSSGGRPRPSPGPGRCASC